MQKLNTQGDIYGMLYLHKTSLDYLSSKEEDKSKSKFES